MIKEIKMANYSPYLAHLAQMPKVLNNNELSIVCCCLRSHPKSIVNLLCPCECHFVN